MGSTEKFSLSWNDHESNISSSFRDLRLGSEFFDVTLCCDNGIDIIQAHKVMLAACSPLFRVILSHTQNQKNPFIYLKGIHSKELQAVLDFMYNGVVSVDQESLSNFLSAAEELAVKGLTTDETPIDGQDAPGPVNLSNFHDEDEMVLKHKRPTGGRKAGKKSAIKRDMVEAQNDFDIKRIKSDPENIFPSDDPEPIYDPDQNEQDFVQIENLQDDENTPGKSVRGGGTANNPETRVVLEEARFSRTKQGNALLIDKDGFCYLINRKSERKIYWKCQKKSSKCCRSNCQTEGFYITRKTAEHTHPPYPPPRNKYTEDY